MPQSVGRDVSVKEVSTCVVNAIPSAFGRKRCIECTLLNPRPYQLHKTRVVLNWQKGRLVTRLRRGETC